MAWRPLSDFKDANLSSPGSRGAGQRRLMEVTSWAQKCCPVVGSRGWETNHVSAESPLLDTWRCGPELAYPFANGFRSKHTGLYNKDSLHLCSIEQTTSQFPHHALYMLLNPGLFGSLTPQDVGRCLALSRLCERFFQSIKRHLC